MSSEKLAAMVQTVLDGVVDSAGAFRLHGILVARHGRLVLEEYFFGEHADKPHDTRSASKTILPVVLGAAMHAGHKVSPETPVYATLGETSGSLEPRKRTMKLLHPLTMSSGLDCDDNGGELLPGNEEVLTEQDTNPDWTRMILGLTTVRDPGDKAVYCSINPSSATRSCGGQQEDGSRSSCGTWSRRQLCRSRRHHHARAHPAAYPPGRAQMSLPMEGLTPGNGGRNSAQGFAALASSCPSFLCSGGGSVAP